MISKLSSGIAIILLGIGIFFSSFSRADAVFTSPHTFMPSDEQAWISLENEMITTPEKVIDIYWSGYGGMIDMMQTFVEAMQTAQTQGKIIIFILQDESYSAHAVAACYADHLVYTTPQIFLMFHRPADQYDKVITDPQYLVIYTKMLQPCLDKGILNQTDVNKMLTIDEVYVYYINNQYVKHYLFDRRL
jgi:hypothetical protein